MFFRSKPSTLPAAAESLPGRATEMPVADKHFRQSQCAQGPLPRERRDHLFRPRLLLGRRAAVLGDAGGDRHRRGLPGRQHAQPHL